MRLGRLLGIRSGGCIGWEFSVAGCVALMILLTVISQVAVSPRMAVLRAQMGSIQATAAGSPLLAEFARLHTISVGLESGVLLAGIAAMFLMVWEAGAR